MSYQKERLKKAEEGLWAGTVAEIEDALRALQSISSDDAPGARELETKLLRRHVAFKKREAETRVSPEWDALEVRREPGGLRHYLDGKPVHCGAGLILQRRLSRFDDYGEYIVHCSGEGFAVRYEASQHDGKIDWTLHADVGGTEFVCCGEPWLRFRAPCLRSTSSNVSWSKELEYERKVHDP